MLNQLNYYSRYNRIKQQDQKTLSSLYTLLSNKTLTKLANDATISLQMINLYRKKSKYHIQNNFNENQEDQHQYLQANINKLYFQHYKDDQLNTESLKIDIKSKHSLEKSRNSIEKSSNSIQKAKSKRSKPNNIKSQRQKTTKNTYLEEIVRQIRQKSKQRVQQTQKFLLQQNKKSLSKKITSKRNKKDKNSSYNQEENPINKVQIIKEAKQKYVFQQNQRQNLLQSQRIDYQKEQDKLKKKDFYRNLTQLRGNKKLEQNAKQQFVQSVQDENEEHSRPSVVIERLNLGKQKQNKNVEQMIKMCIKNKQFQSQSKQDNAGSQEGKQSQIKSLQKQEIKVHKPSRNLIDLQFNRSQSEIIKSSQRCLDMELVQTALQQMYDSKIRDLERNAGQNQQKMNELNGKRAEQFDEKQLIQSICFVPKQVKQSQQILVQKNQAHIRSNPLSNRTVSKPDSLKQQLQDQVVEKLEEIDQSYPMTKSYKTINNIVPAHFLSQINNRKSVQQPPYEHPLQVITQSQQQQIVQAHKIGIQRQQSDKKQSFKKFMMNKQLNPRLVTSTILIQKNTNNKGSRQNLRDSQKSNQKNNHPSPFKDISTEKPQKKTNFKQMINKKNKINEPVAKKIQQNSMPLRRISNKKLLQGFFNDN